MFNCAIPNILTSPNTLRSVSRKWYALKKKTERRAECGNECFRDVWWMRTSWLDLTAIVQRGSKYIHIAVCHIVIFHSLFYVLFLFAYASPFRPEEHFSFLFITWLLSVRLRCFVAVVEVDSGRKTAVAIIPKRIQNDGVALSYLRSPISQIVVRLFARVCVCLCVLVLVLICCVTHLHTSHRIQWNRRLSVPS